MKPGVTSSPSASRTAVEAADLGTQILDVDQAFLRAHHVGAGAARGRILLARIEIAAHAGGQVDDHIGFAVADALDDLGVELGAPARRAAVGFAHVTVSDRRPGLGGLDRGLGDLLGGHGHRRVLVHRIPGAGHSAGDDHLAVHRTASLLQAMAGTTRACPPWRPTGPLPN